MVQLFKVDKGGARGRERKGGTSSRAPTMEETRAPTPAAVATGAPVAEARTTGSDKPGPCEIWATIARFSKARSAAGEFEGEEGCVDAEDKSTTREEERDDKSEGQMTTAALGFGSRQPMLAKSSGGWQRQ